LHGSQYGARVTPSAMWNRRSKKPEPEPQADSPAADSPEPGPQADSLTAGPPPRTREPRPLQQCWGDYSFGEGHGGSQRYSGERKGARAGEDPASGSARAALDGGERERKGKGDSGEDSGDGDSHRGDGDRDEEEPLLPQPQWRRRVAPRSVSARMVEDQNREANWGKGCFARGGAGTL
jgi:hypothetical protein